MRRIGSLLTIATIAMATAMIGAVPAAAEEKYNPLAVVIDSSGSMAEKDAGGGQTRMDAAKKAVTTFVDQLPDDARVGLAAYGSKTGSSAGEKAAGCKDYTQLAPVGNPDKPALKSAINALKASGYTPIGYALRKAAESLPKEGGRSIVLVSDGEDTCAPPQPCEVAKELAKQGVDMRIHTVGFKVSGAARDQLVCIAKATGGTYSDAESGSALQGALPRVAAKALRSYQPRGIPVDGSPDPQTAPALTAGSYLDDLGTGEKSYAVDVPDGWRVYFSATVILPYKNNLGVELLRVAASGPDGKQCTVSPVSKVIAGASDGAVATVAVAYPDPNSYCKAAGKHTFTVSRPHPSEYQDTPVLTRPLEIQVYLEPPIVGDAGPSVPYNENSVEFTPQSGTATWVVGGGSFVDATELPGSGRYTDALQASERVFFKVKLGWGQGLAYRLTAGPVSGVTGMESRVYSSVRTEYAYTAETGTKAQTRTLKPVVTPKIYYHNRDNTGATHLMSLSGWYYVEAFITPGYGYVEGAATPVTLEVNVVGDAISTPQYDGQVGAAPSGSVAGSIKPKATASDDGSRLPWIVAAICVLVGAAGVGGSALWLIRRRHGST